MSAERLATRPIRLCSLNTTTLNQLKRGARARVVDLDHRDTKLIAKLAARGLVPGAELSIVRSGDPLLIFVDESRWALTTAEAEKVAVEDLGTTSFGITRSIRNLWRKPKPLST